MTQYLLNYIKGHEKLKKTVILTEDISPKIVMYIFYGMLSILAIKRDKRFFACGVIPWFDFFVVTKIRNKINRQRPFEKLNFEPIVEHSSGKSCPSRHASSSVIITMAVYFISPFWGFITGILSILVCLSRVVSGVHYISDVIIGALISIIIGKLTFFGVLKEKK